VSLKDDVTLTVSLKDDVTVHTPTVSLKDNVTLTVSLKDDVIPTVFLKHNVTASVPGNKIEGAHHFFHHSLQKYSAKRICLFCGVSREVFI